MDLNKLTRLLLTNFSVYKILSFPIIRLCDKSEVHQTLITVIWAPWWPLLVGRHDPSWAPPPTLPKSPHPLLAPQLNANSFSRSLKHPLSQVLLPEYWPWPLLKLTRYIKTFLKLTRYINAFLKLTRYINALLKLTRYQHHLRKDHQPWCAYSGPEKLKV